MWTKSLSGTYVKWEAKQKLCFDFGEFWLNATVEYKATFDRPEYVHLMFACNFFPVNSTNAITTAYKSELLEFVKNEQDYKLDYQQIMDSYAQTLLENYGDRLVESKVS